MSRPKITKATRAEKLQYSNGRQKPVYPLYGFVSVGETKCVIEYLGEGDGNPNYEVIAPDGMKFAEHDLHNVLCQTADDLLEQMAGVTIEPCNDGAGCDWCNGDSRDTRGYIKATGGKHG